MKPAPVARALALLVAAVAAAFAAGYAHATPPAGLAADQCYVCHLEEGRVAKAYEQDVHAALGIGCADCHGGDAGSDDKDVAMSRERGYRGPVRKSDIPALCGRCHGAKDSPWRKRHRLTDVADSLAAGVHGEALRANPAGPQCVSCHGVHDILPISDRRSPVHPTRVARTCGACHSDARYMRQFNPRLPVDQYEKYLTSEHGRLNAAGDARPATCVSCHANHFVLRVKDPRSPTYPTRVPGTCSRCHASERYMRGYDIPTNQYEQYRRSRHGIALLERSDLNAPACNSCHGNHGAIPPGASAVAAVCGNCHQSNMELFEKSAHRAPFERKRLAGCVVCHGNHGIQSPTDSLVAFTPPAPCAECHRDEASDRSAPGLHRLRAMLDSLRVGQSEAQRVLHRAEQLGMDVSDATYSLKQAHQALVQSRVAIHSFRVADLAEVARPGLTVIASARGAAEAAVREYYFRRQGLAISTLLVTLVAVLLYAKIRQIERRQRAGRD